MAITEIPSRFYKNGPGGAVAFAGRGKTTGALKGSDRSLGSHAVETRIDTRRSEPGRAQPSLEIADGITVVARLQWESGRNSFSSDSI